MSGIQSKITRHAKKQENTTWSEEKKKPISTDIKLTHMLEIVDRDIKTVITVFQMFKKLTRDRKV